MKILVLERYSNDAKQGHPEKLIEAIREGIFNVDRDYLVGELVSHSTIETLIHLTGYKIAKHAFFQQAKDVVQDRYNMVLVDEEDPTFNKMWERIAPTLNDDDFDDLTTLFEPAYFELSLEEDRNNTLFFPTLRSTIKALKEDVEHFEKDASTLETLLDDVQRFDDAMATLEKALAGADEALRHSLRRKFNDRDFDLPTGGAIDQLIQQFALTVANSEEEKELEKQAQRIKEKMSDMNMDLKSGLEICESDLFPMDDVIEQVVRDVFPNVTNIDQSVIDEIANKVVEAQSNTESYLFDEQLSGDVVVSEGYSNQFFLTPLVELDSLDAPFFVLDQNYIREKVEQDDSHLERLQALIKDFNVDEAVEFGYIDPTFDYSCYEMDILDDYGLLVQEIQEFKEGFDNAVRRIPEVVKEEITSDQPHYEERLNVTE